MSIELTKEQQKEYDLLINKINGWNHSYQEMDKMMRYTKIQI